MKIEDLEKKIMKEYRGKLKEGNLCSDYDKGWKDALMYVLELIGEE